MAHEFLCRARDPLVQDGAGDADTGSTRVVTETVELTAELLVDGAGPARYGDLPGRPPGRLRDQHGRREAWQAPHPVGGSRRRELSAADADPLPGPDGCPAVGSGLRIARGHRGRPATPDRPRTAVSPWSLTGWRGHDRRSAPARRRPAEPSSPRTSRTRPTSAARPTATTRSCGVGTCRPNRLLPARPAAGRPHAGRRTGRPARRRGGATPRRRPAGRDQLGLPARRARRLHGHAARGRPGHGEDPRPGPIGLDARSPAWWHDGRHWHLAHLAVTPPGLIGGLAVFDARRARRRRRGAAQHRRNLTAGLDVCPIELVQVAGGPPLALFADGLDTAVYRLDPTAQRFRRVSARPGRLDMLTASALGEDDRRPGEHRLRAAGRLRRAAGRPAGTGQRHAAGGSPDPVGHPGAPVLPGPRWPCPRRPAHPAARPVPGRRPVPADHHGARRTLRPLGRRLPRLLVGAGPVAGRRRLRVFLPNPRGSQGHGHEFAATVSGAVGTDEWTDLLQRDRPARRRRRR